MEKDRETLILGPGKLTRDRGQFEARALHLKRDTSEIDRLSESGNPPTRDLRCLRDYLLNRRNPVRNAICRDLEDPIAPRIAQPVFENKVGVNPGQFLRNAHEDRAVARPGPYPSLVRNEPLPKVFWTAVSLP